MTPVAKLVESYRKFYRAQHPFQSGSAALPVAIAFDVLRDADRKLFPDREDLAEVIAGQIIEQILEKTRPADTENPEVYRQLLEFGRLFLDTLPDQAIADPGFVRKPLRDLIESACAVLFFDAERDGDKKLSVTDLAKRARVRREYVIAEIRRGNIENVEKIGLSYAIPESSAQKWLDNPRRGSRSQ